MEYIDAEKLIDDIKRRKQELQKRCNNMKHFPIQILEEADRRFGKLRDIDWQLAEEIQRLIDSPSLERFLALARRIYAMGIEKGVEFSQKL